jgi:hypothetical protein
LSVIGILLQLAYRLHRHSIAAWSLARWLGAILFLAGVAVLIVQRSVTWRVILPAALLFIFLVMMLWAGQKRYIHFRASPPAEALLKRMPAPLPLQPEELVPVRATGSFTVHGQGQDYVGLDAEYESVQSREHVILARVASSRFLWLGGSPDHEVGFWYIFFQPAMLRQLRAGYLHFGPQPQLAIEIVYSSADDSRHSVYLASDATLLRRIGDDLMRDAPPEASRWAAGDVS